MSFMLPMHRAKMYQAEREGFEEGKAEGRREVLRRVAKLPLFDRVSGAKGGKTSWLNGVRVAENYYGCEWCGWRVTVDDDGKPVTHPANGCLWPDAQQVAREDAERIKESQQC